MRIKNCVWVDGFHKYDDGDVDGDDYVGGDDNDDVDDDAD